MYSIGTFSKLTKTTVATLRFYDKEGLLIFKELPGCKVACLYFKGSNKYIGAGFAFLYDWINKSGYTPCDCPRECYIDGLWNVDSVDLWLTEIQIPIK